MRGCRDARVPPASSFAGGFGLALGALVALLLLFPTASAAKVVEDGSLPSMRVGSSAVWTGTYFYVVGGRDAERYMDDIVKFDPRTGKSEVVARLPPVTGALGGGRQSTSAVWTGDALYVFGGAALFSVVLEGKQATVPLSIDQIVEWRPGSAPRALSEKLPAPVWGTSAVWSNGKASVFGGFEFGVGADGGVRIERKNTIVTFNPNPGLGRPMVELSVSRLPYRVQDASVAVGNERAWLFGGLADHDGQSVSCPTYFNPETNQTEHMTACPVSRIISMRLDSEAAFVAGVGLDRPLQYTAAAAVGDVIYVLGGRQMEGAAAGTIQRFDPKGPAIETMIPALPGGRYGLPAVSDGSVIRLFGGRDATVSPNGMESVLRFVPGATEPWAPRELSGVSDEAGILLRWAAPLYDGGAPITAYRIHRAYSNATDPVPELLAEVPGGALSYRDTSAEAGATYLYRVTASNHFGDSPSGTEGELRAKTRPPSEPRFLQAFAGDSSVLLRWGPPKSNGGLSIGGYRVYRDGTLIESALPASSLSYTDVGRAPGTEGAPGLENGKAYAYVVAAFNGDGEGKRSVEKVAVPAPVPASPEGLTIKVESSSLLLEWGPAPGAVRGYHLYKGAEPYNVECIKDNVGQCLLLTETTYRDEAVTRGLMYHFHVTAIAIGGESPPSPTASAGIISPPSPPLSLIAAPGPGKVTLTWQRPADTGGSQRLLYFVSRTGPDGNPLRIANDIAETRFTDTAVLPGFTYKYAVTAYNPLPGKASDEKSATPTAVQNAPPKPALSATPVAAQPGETIRFDASLTRDEDGRVVEYAFDFGDGTRPVVTKSPGSERTYERNGTYTVKVTVKDDRGATATAQIVVSVGRIEDAPEPRFTEAASEHDPTRVAGDVLPDPPGSAPGKKMPAPGLGTAIALLGLAAVGAARSRRR